MARKIIAFGYQSFAGKDTASKMLMKECRMAGIRDVRHVPFAWKLKQVAADLYGMYGLKGPQYYEDNLKEKDIPLPTIHKTPVEIWIALGDTLKRATYDRMWSDYVLKNNLEADVLIISDLRYPIEFQDIQALGGRCIKVECPRAKIKGSDAYLDSRGDWNAIIDNSGDLRYLHAQVMAIYEAFVVNDQGGKA